MPGNDDLELGESDYEEDVTFPPPERKIVTQAYDLSVTTLVEQWDDGLLIIPDLQREYVWDNARASRLIESLMLNLPVPPVFFSENRDAQYEIIDGHQRVRSIVRFIKNEFPLSSMPLQPEFIRLRFHQLPDREQRFLKTRVLRAIVISADSHPNMKFEIFQRLNTGAIALNAQEIRNALNQGPLNDSLKRLVRDPAFRQCLGSKSPRRRMVDEELVLRFLALHAHLAGYRPPLLRVLNTYMREHRDMTGPERDAIEYEFVLAANFTVRTFPNGAYRITDAKGKVIEFPLNRALFDAEMIAASWVNPACFDSVNYSDVRIGASKLYKDFDFLDAIGRATGDRKRLLTRTTQYAEMLQAAGVDIEIPLLETS